MSGYSSDFYGNGHFSTGMVSRNLQANGHFNSTTFSMIAQAGQPYYNQRLDDVHCYPESVTSCGSEEYEEQYMSVQRPQLEQGRLRYGLQRAPYYQLNVEAGNPEDCMYQHHNFQVTGNGMPVVRGEYGYPRAMTLPTENTPYLDDQWNVRNSSCCYNKGSRVSKLNFHHFGRESHLSKMIFSNRKSELKNRRCKGAEGKKKRYRPFAAIRERERLAVMNAALKELKTCLPLDNHEQKLSKKQILLSAAVYIKHLSEELGCKHEASSEEKEQTVNLNEHNYIPGPE